MPATEGRSGQVAVAQDLAALERAVDDLAEALATAGGAAPRSEVERLRALRDDLASHALAARVLVGAGASPEAVAALLERAEALLAPSRQSA